MSHNSNSEAFLASPKRSCLSLSLALSLSLSLARSLALSLSLSRSLYHHVSDLYSPNSPLCSSMCCTEDVDSSPDGFFMKLDTQKLFRKAFPSIHQTVNSSCTWISAAVLFICTHSLSVSSLCRVTLAPVAYTCPWCFSPVALNWI